MAKATGSRSNGTSRIRFIMLEADLGDGDLTQVTQAISNALRQGTSAQQQRFLPPSAANPAPTVSDGAPAEALSQLGDLSTEDEVFAPDASHSRQKNTKPRTYRTPEVVTVDFTSGELSFAKFAAEKNPQNDSKRFLTVMAWFKRYREKAAIGVDEVYTAYRSGGVEWPYGIKDYDGVFRNLVSRKLAKREGKGLYAINQVGEAAIERKGE